MKKSRFTEEPMVKILQEADRNLSRIGNRRKMRFTRAVKAPHKAWEGSRWARPGTTAKRKI